MVRNSYLPHVEEMIADPGVYFLHDPRLPNALVPILSKDGKLYSMVLDSELDPSGFFPGPVLEGPIRTMQNRPKDELGVSFNVWRINAASQVKELLEALPKNKDWLDPDLELRLRGLLE